MRATAAVAAHFGDVRMRSVRPMLADDGALARHIGEIRELCRALIRLQTQTGSDRQRAARQIAQREQDVQRLAQALEADRSALVADAASLAQDERVVSHEIEALRRYALLGERIDNLVTERARELSSTNGQAARTLEVQVLFAVRQRRRDLLTQLAVATQAQASLRLMQRNNLDVIRALTAAATTTLTALRTTGLALRVARERTEAAAQLAMLESGRALWMDVLKNIDEVDARRRALAGRDRRR